MIRVPTHRAPTHPGEMLLEEFLIPMDLTQRELAKAIHVPYQRINELVNGRRGMNLQLRWDLYHTQQSEARDLETIKPYTLPADAVG